MSSIVNLDVVKERNISAVYKTILTHGSVSRTEIARHCQLAPGSVTRITRQLLDNGLIEEMTAAPTPNSALDSSSDTSHEERGRKAMPLAIAHNRIQILAARVGRTRLHIGLKTISGDILAKYSEPLQHHSSQEEFSQHVIHSLQAFLHQHRHVVTQIAGVGVAVPGLVNPTDGVVTFMPHIEVNNLPLAQLISEALGLPCKINNFISAMTLAESQLGALKGYQNSLMVSVHNGVGAGLITNGALYEGSGAAVGELGHIQIDPLGLRCQCGNYGCLETLVSNPAIEKRCCQLLAGGALGSLSTLPPDDVTMVKICEAANAGDALATNLLKEAAANLGKALAMSVNLLRPEVIVLSGEICLASDIVHPVLTHCLQTQAVNIAGVPPTKIVNAHLYESPWYAGYSLILRALTDQGLLWQLLKQTDENRLVS